MSSSFGDRYGPTARFLHKLALGPASVRRVAFDLDRSYALPHGTPPEDIPVYVCGMARSGTTLVLDILADADCVRSLTYRDMPFVLSPNLWSRLSGRHGRQIAPSERAHGDGVLVDLDSPEAFEEVFWRTFADPATSHDPSLAGNFAAYRALVANPQRGPRAKPNRPNRYLSKNNNNLGRLDLLADIGAGEIVVVYRNPFATASSLWTQHRRFSHLQAHDRFYRDYMDWLGHREFGSGHRTPGGLEGPHDPISPDYWLALWTMAYRSIAERTDLSVRLLSYDALCAKPGQGVRSLYEALALNGPHASSANAIRSGQNRIWSTFAGPLSAQAEQVFNSLLTHSRNILPLSRDPS